MDIKRATKEALLERAAKRDAAKAKYRDFYCKALGETLIIKKIGVDRICDILDMADGDTMRANMEVNKQLVYESVPLFQDKEIQEAYGCIEPYDIVLAVLDDDMNELQHLCSFILNMYGLGSLDDDIKN